MKDSNLQELLLDISEWNEISEDIRELSFVKLKNTMKESNSIFFIPLRYYNKAIYLYLFYKPVIYFRIRFE